MLLVYELANTLLVACTLTYHTGEKGLWTSCPNDPNKFPQTLYCWRYCLARVVASSMCFASYLTFAMDSGTFARKKKLQLFFSWNLDDGSVRWLSIGWNPSEMLNTPFRLGHQPIPGWNCQKHFPPGIVWGPNQKGIYIYMCVYLYISKEKCFGDTIANKERTKL